MDLDDIDDTFGRASGVNATSRRHPRASRSWF